MYKHIISKDARSSKMLNCLILSLLCTETVAFVYIFYALFSSSSFSVFLLFGSLVFLIVQRLSRFLFCRSSLSIPSQLITTTRLPFRRYILS